MAHDGSSPTNFATEGDIDARPFLAEAEAIVAKQAETASRRQSGVCWSAMTTPIDDVETVRARLVEFEAGRVAYLASPVGKARSVLSKACKVCELNNWAPEYAALDAVGAALSRGDDTAERAVEAAQVRLAALPEGDAKEAVLLLATELLLLVRQVGSAS